MEQDEIIPLTLTKTIGDPFLEIFVINVIIIDSDGKCYIYISEMLITFIFIFKYLNIPFLVSIQNKWIYIL